MTSPGEIVSRGPLREGPELRSADPLLTRRVLESFGTATSPRLRAVLESLTLHLHAFASDIDLTEEEWSAAIDFVTRVGQMSDERRQETILLSDVFGLSMLVVAINHPATAPITESTVIGPFFVDDSPGFSNGDDLSGGAPGAPCFYTATVSGSDGQPLAGARVEVWHSDEDGNYDVQYADGNVVQGRGHLFADQDGHIWFLSVLPEPYPIPVDGPVGDLLSAAERSPMRPAHVHFMISSPGYRTLTTHVFRAGDQYLGADAVFGEKESLVRTFEHHGPGPGPDRRQMPSGFFTMSYDFVLEILC